MMQLIQADIPRSHCPSEGQTRMSEAVYIFTLQQNFVFRPPTWQLIFMLSRLKSSALSLTSIILYYG